MNKAGAAINRKCEIWAVASGKGGTGKSFITSSLGTYLAAKGNRVILIDADLGGANLHTLLGINKPKNTLTDFFEKKVPLNDVIVNCGVSDLGLVSGLLNSLNAESINYAQKLKFFRHIKILDADYALIDLGAGSHNNTVDTFLLAEKMIVVTIPEITALENMYHFIKNVYFRKMKLILSEHGLKDMVQDVWKNREARGIKNFRELIIYLTGVSSHIRDILEDEMSRFKIYIMVNQTRSSGDIQMGTNIKSLCLKFLGLPTVYAGHVGYDDCVTKCINKRQSFMLSYAFSNAAREIGLLSDNIKNGGRVAVDRETYVGRGA